VRQGFSLSRTGTRIARHPPAQGTDTADVLAEFGYDEAAIAALRSGGAI
jgi:crotonobetainyl-CoA:carnitine CoA-transferase CaiB-like acyl-CoA transferase